MQMTHQVRAAARASSSVALTSAWSIDEHPPKASRQRAVAASSFDGIVARRRDAYETCTRNTARYSLTRNFSAPYNVPGIPYYLYSVRSYLVPEKGWGTMCPGHNVVPGAHADK